MLTCLAKLGACLVANQTYQDLYCIFVLCSSDFVTMPPAIPCSFPLCEFLTPANPTSDAAKEIHPLHTQDVHSYIPSRVDQYDLTNMVRLVHTDTYTDTNVERKTLFQLILADTDILIILIQY